MSSAAPEGYVGSPPLVTHVLKGERGRDFDNIKRDITAVISMTQILCTKSVIMATIKHLR